MISKSCKFHNLWQLLQSLDFFYLCSTNKSSWIVAMFVLWLPVSVMTSKPKWHRDIVTLLVTRRQQDNEEDQKVHKFSRVALLVYENTRELYATTITDLPCLQFCKHKNIAKRRYDSGSMKKGVLPSQYREQSKEMKFNKCLQIFVSKQQW